MEALVCAVSLGLKEVVEAILDNCLAKSGLWDRGSIGQKLLNTLLGSIKKFYLSRPFGKNSVMKRLCDYEFGQ